MRVNTLIVALTLMSASAIADVAVIVHPSNANTLSADEIRKIFTGKMKTFPDGGQVVPINQKEGVDMTTEFNTKVLSKSASQLKAYWSKLVFTGKGTPPKDVQNNDEVLKLVGSNPNIIGYVDGASINDSVKVISTF